LALDSDIQLRGCLLTGQAPRLRTVIFFPQPPGKLASLLEDLKSLLFCLGWTLLYQKPCRKLNSAEPYKFRLPVEFLQIHFQLKILLPTG
jgi:hypothetical protein